MKKRYLLPYLEAAMVIATAFLFVLGYYLVLTKLLSGQWLAYFRSTDILDMLLTAVSIPFAYVAAHFAKPSIGRTFMLVGLSVGVFLMLVVVSANRVLAIDPGIGSGIGIGIIYILITILAFSAHIAIAYGYIRSVGSKKSS